MDWFQALVLGVVEGLTEYLPVSSTAHLLLAQRALGVPQGEASDAYAICIQAGAILAVLGIFSRRVAQMLRGLAGRDPAGLRLAVNVVIAFVPAMVVGLLLNKTIKEHLFHLGPICVAWLVGGVAILAFDFALRRRLAAKSGRGLHQLTLAGALMIGVLQCLGMVPGTSRSLVTILGGLLVGLGIEAALEFSFLLGLVTLTAATVYDASKHGAAMRAAYEPLPIALGFLAAAVAAAVAVTWMIRYLRRRGLAVFGYYRIALAVVVAALLWSGRITP